MKFASLDNLSRLLGVIKIGFSSTTAKTTLVDADAFLITDSADTETVNGVANVKKRKAISWANFKTELGTYFAANDAMVYKGTLGTAGTVTALPTTHQVGWTYRVITAGTYAGNVCEIGDLLIALVDRSGSGNVNADWTVAQANADLSGIPLAATANPATPGTNAVGVATKYAREDHDHGKDSTKLDGTHAGTGGGAHADVVAAGASGFMTGADKTKLNGVEALADVTDGVNVGAAMWGATAKATPIDADTIVLSDTGASNVIKKATFANIKAFLKTYFDTLYQASGAYAAASHAHGSITNGGAIGSTTDLPVVTGAAGAVIVGAWASDSEIDALVI